MKNSRVVFTKPWEVELVKETFVPQELGPNQALVKKIYTMISPGTELACLSGEEFWFSMPNTPGYAAISEIVDIDEGNPSFKRGDIVYHMGNHAKYELVPTSGVFLKVPEKLDLKQALFTRMATVAATAVRVSNIEFGDYVSVSGLGLVGNFAAQLAELQGAFVIGIDLASERKEIAEKCGISYTLGGDKEDNKERLMEITSGVGVSTHIEATGIPQVGVDSLELIASLGEIIFLGTPRGEHKADITEILNYCHLFNNGCITFKGAHEWRYSIEPDKFNKHSVVRNAQVIFELMIQGKLQVEPLLSHVLSPEQAAEAYDGLRNHKDEYFGVIFDWSKEGGANA